MRTNGIVLLKPASISKTGSSSVATIQPNGSIVFSGCNSLSLNGVFASEYDNYILNMFIENPEQKNFPLFLRLRNAEVDNSLASSYTYQNVLANSTTVSGARTANTGAQIQQFGGIQVSGVSVFLYGPFLPQPTAGRSVGAETVNSATVRDFGFTHNQSLSYDGFTLSDNNTGYRFGGVLQVCGLVN
jgi:hypothetical protein